MSADGDMLVLLLWALELTGLVLDQLAERVLMKRLIERKRR